MWWSFFFIAQLLLWSLLWLWFRAWLIISQVVSIHIMCQKILLFSSQSHNLRVLQWELQKGVPSFEACGKWMSEYTVFFYCVSIKEARQNFLWVNFTAWNVWSSPATQLYQIIISFSLFELRILEFPIYMNNEIYSRCEIFIANKSNVTIDANEGNKKRQFMKLFADVPFRARPRSSGNNNCCKPTSATKWLAIKKTQ